MQAQHSTMSNYPHKQEVLEALEFAEKMALVTIYDDDSLHKSLFELGELYKRICDGEFVKESKVKKVLEKFYAIDPDMIAIMKGDPDAFTKIA